ncbi:MAG: hypothetical protein IPJ00_17110 [Saprospirales bacterium]|nr:hypothetical protein [Saprospirales bacterium]
MKTARIFPYFSLAGMLIAAPACKNNPSDGEDESTTEQADTSSTARTYTLTPFSESAQFADASIDKMTFKNGKFDFAIGGSTYKLGVQTPDAPQKMCALTPPKIAYPRHRRQQSPTTPSIPPASITRSRTATTTC